MFQRAYMTDEERIRVKTINNEPSRTKQSFAEELNVDNIIRRVGANNIAAAYQFEGSYGEFDEMDMAEAIEKVDKARALFLAVPSKIRAEFDNNPGKFIDFVTNPANEQAVRDMGLANEIQAKEESLGAKLDAINATLQQQQEAQSGA